MIDDITSAVAADMTVGDKRKISPLLLWVIKEVVMLAITWFINHYKDDPSKTIDDFLSFFKNMGLWKSLRWSMKVMQVTKKYKDLGSDKSRIAGSTAGRFANLDEATVRAMFEEAISSQSQ